MRRQNIRPGQIPIREAELTICQGSQRVELVGGQWLERRHAISDVGDAERHADECDSQEPSIAQRFDQGRKSEYLPRIRMTCTLTATSATYQMATNPNDHSSLAR